MKKRILFVCLGNICRSPSAEAVFRALIEKKGVAEEFEIDSAGTSGWHEGEPADRRMQHHAQKRGYHLTSCPGRFIRNQILKHLITSWPWITKTLTS